LKGLIDILCFLILDWEMTPRNGQNL
jgi:hypothetical protein